MPPEDIADALSVLGGVRQVRRVRSRWAGSQPAVDVVITVAPELPTNEAHEVADAIEALLLEKFEVEDVTVHIEPDEVFLGVGMWRPDPVSLRHIRERIAARPGEWRRAWRASGGSWCGRRW